ncbi:glycoside hydrolase family 28 protein [Brotaphodocola sp.]|uniref:glycoside hydrolase family 28 protein n=1 Tax=Brotaphodocola sp. TaxID=3073577 RepID=UPI003D7E93B2
MEKLQLREEILSRMELPVIADRQYSVQEFGVVPDSEEIQTVFLQKAIDTVNEQGGGRIVFPAGSYLTGALHLKSGVELHLESADTVLKFVNEEVSLHYPLVFSHWEATPCYNFSPLIYACDAHDIAVTGCGVLDGGADREHWWNWHHQVENAWSSNRRDLQLEDRKALREMNENGTPVEERVFGDGHFLRPNFVQPIRCKRVLLQGFTLKNSPMWQLNPVMCESLTVDGVTMSSHGANNDGCDPESCSGVHIKNCRFDTGDDCISLKSGRDRDGRIANKACEYVLIENNEFADGHGGVALGSEMSGGIRHVLAMNNRFSSPNLTYALRLKTNAKRGGMVEEVTLADSVMDHVHGAAVHGTMLYEDGRNGEYLPVFRNIRIENITAHGGDYGIFLEAFDEVPITGLVLKNIVIDGAKKMIRCMNWKDPVVENVVINGSHFPRPISVRITDIPRAGDLCHARAELCDGVGECRFTWKYCGKDGVWNVFGSGQEVEIPADACEVQVSVCDSQNNMEESIVYRVLSEMDADCKTSDRNVSRRLWCRGMLEKVQPLSTEPITREKLAKMMIPLMETEDKKEAAAATPSCLETALRQGFLKREKDGSLKPDGVVSRQEMATVAMQACGVNYRNASSTMPVCEDVGMVDNNYGTNVARALYFGFMELDGAGCFRPLEPVTEQESAVILNRVADFAGI